MPTTRMVEIIDQKEFAAAALSEDNETFVVHITAIVGLTRMTKLSCRHRGIDKDDNPHLLRGSNRLNVEEVTVSTE